ncbi:MAG: transcription termination factor Rho [Lachnospirales bacterium]
MLKHKYSDMKLTELRIFAKKMNIGSVTKYKKDELIKLLEEGNAEISEEDSKSSKQESDDIEVSNDKKEDSSDDDDFRSNFKDLDSGITESGILEVLPDGYGFLRQDNFLPGSTDIYVSPAQIRRFKLRTGDRVKGNLRIPKENEKFRPLLYISTVNGANSNTIAYRSNFEDLTPIYPLERLTLETNVPNASQRMIDLFAPIGKGQRGMIVAPPKTGKTTLLKTVANSIVENNPNINLIVLLIDERPEEVTDMKRSIIGKHVEVVYSTFDEGADHHKRVAEMVLERGKRLVEQKMDVVILLDSITRLARAYNLTVPPSGRTLSGGLDPASLYMPKKFFGAARNIEDGGSLTILATALVETGSKMDDVIFEEFKGTGNMELVLDRKISDKRIFPAIDIIRSGTRRDDLLLNKNEQEAIYNIRRQGNKRLNYELTEIMLNRIKKTKNNEELITISGKK